MSRTVPLLSLLIAVALALVACTSAEERLEQGRELESAGRQAQAARRYVQALRQDPALGEARQRLQVAGRGAVAAFLAQAEQDRRRGDAVARADSHLAAEAIILEARSVQVTLPVPPDFAAERRRAMDAAIAALIADADALAAGGRWSQALAPLERVADFDPTPAQVRRVAHARVRTLTRWAGAELDAGHPRAALDVAEQGLAAAPGGDAHRGLLAIRDEALQAARVTVAFLPLAGGDGSAGDRAFIAAVNDALELEHWLEHPPLVVPRDPRAVRHAIRGRGAGALDTRAAVRVGRRLGTDLVVVTTLQELGHSDSGVRERQRNTKTRDGQPARYRERSGTRRRQARARFRIVPVAGGPPSATYAVTASHAARFTEARYDGDPQRLALGARERRAFETGDDDAQALADRLAERLATRMFDAILERIP